MIRILVVGSGGREHALLWALRHCPEAGELYIAPGNGGTDSLAQTVPLAADDLAGLTDFACREAIDLVVVGPEVPLALGLVDRLQQEGVAAFGPVAAAAQLEGSKVFSKQFMVENGIPTAAHRAFDAYEAAWEYAQTQPLPLVVKATGLAAGKGVIICQTHDEARAALDSIMRARDFGAAGDEVVIEEFLSGQEVSVLAFCDGTVAVPMVLAQDHKAAYDGDRGPNTGGMGAYAPAPLLDDAQLGFVRQRVLQPVLDGMAARGTPYKGVLYAGLMLGEQDIHVLEFNCRFGDPETQVILPLLETSLVQVMQACLNGTLAQLPIVWKDASAVCVVLAAGGYPGSYRKGVLITGLAEAEALSEVTVFHAGTRREDDQVVTAGGRVLGVTAVADDLASAQQLAYRAAGMIRWQDMRYRHDIAAKGLAREV